MKLLAVVAFGLLATRSEAFFGSSRQNENNPLDTHQSHTDENIEYGSNKFGYLSQNQQNQRYQLNQQNQPNQQNKQGLNDEYSESNWNAQTSYLPLNQVNKQIEQNSYKSANTQDSQWTGSQVRLQNHQNSEEQTFQQMLNKKYQNNPTDESLSSFNAAESRYSLEIGSQDDYTKEQSKIIDVSDNIGHSVAQKMVKFFNIIGKYTGLDGTVKVHQAQEPLNFRHFTMSLPNHQFLNINNSYVIGLNQGIVKEMYLNADSNSVDMKYFFNNLSINGNVKTGSGYKRSFNLMITNTNVNVSTEMENRNRNRNYGYSSIENAELNYQNIQEFSSSENLLLTTNIKNQYVQFIRRAIENELIDNCYNGLVACLKHEIETPFYLSTNYDSNMMITNKKSKFSVSLERTQSWISEQSNDLRKVQFVGFRKNMNGSGYQVKVKVFLAIRPTWTSDVVAKKGQQQITIRNVNFRAQNIFATAVMERVQQNSGEYKFQVQDAKIVMDGFRYNIEKFDELKNENQNFAREIGQNLQKIIENGLSAALKQNLYQQQEICQLDGTKDCAKCNQQNAPQL